MKYRIGDCLVLKSKPPRSNRNRKAFTPVPVADGGIIVEIRIEGVFYGTLDKIFFIFFIYVVY